MEEIIKNLYKFLTKNRYLNTKEEMKIIQDLKDLETILCKEGKTSLAEKVTERMDAYYPFDAVCEILDEKIGVFCDGYKLVKTSKTIKRNYGHMSDYLYFKKINHGDYLRTECTRKPKEFFVGNYWYVFIGADVHELREFIKELLFDIHGVSDAMRTVINDHYEEKCFQLLGQMSLECRQFLTSQIVNEDGLWSKSVTQQITDMKALHNSLMVKPKFLSMFEIEELEQKLNKKLEKEVYDVLYSD